MRRHLRSLTQLRTFEAAGRHLSLTRAAAELAVTQGAVSRQVRELERDLGHRLFRRTAHGIVLTPAGRRLMPSLTDALDRSGIPCIELQALVVSEDMPPISRPPRFTELVEAFRPEIIMSGFTTIPTDAEVDTFRRAVDEVTHHGAIVAIEFLPMMPVDTIAKTLDIVHRVGGPVGVCVDTWHFFRGPDSWTELEALPAEDLA